jgi:16S rRNA (cytosine967-C5)-methyltransferase
LSTKSRKMSPARLAAFQLLCRWRQSDRYADELLREHLDSGRLSPADQGLTQEIFYGVFRNRIYLDFLVDRMAKKGLESLPEDLVDILRMGFYQLLFLDRVPDYAVIDESCRLVRSKVSPRLVGMTNGLLRSCQRLRKQLPGIPGAADTPCHLSIQYSVPEWIVRKFLSQYGPEKCRQILKAAGSQPPITLRVNCLKTDRGDLSAQFKQAGLKTEDHPGFENALIVEGAGRVEEWPGYREGLWQVQDAAAQRVAPLLEPRAGEWIWDMASAPGGKATHLFELSKGKARLFLSDINRIRLKNVRDNRERLYGESPLMLWVAEGRKPALKENVRFDKILLDVPCTGLGALSRRVDLRYRVQREDILRLAQLQLALLDSAAQRLRPGGILCYSTCTLSAEENSGVVNRFLERNPGFSRYRQEDLLILPQAGLQDGSFAATLTREA